MKNNPEFNVKLVVFDGEDEWHEQFKRQASDWAEVNGCFVWGVKSDREITPLTVEKTKKGFLADCFSNKPFWEFAKAFDRYGKGNPILFLITQQAMTSNKEKYWTGRTKWKSRQQ